MIKLCYLVLLLFLLFVQNFNLALLFNQGVILCNLPIWSPCWFLRSCSSVIKWSGRNLIIIVTTIILILNLVLNANISRDRSHTVKLWVDLVNLLLDKQIFTEKRLSSIRKDKIILFWSCFRPKSHILWVLLRFWVFLLAWDSYWFFIMIQ